MADRLDALLSLRAERCRLADAADLVDLEDAASFLADRGLLALTPCCALPSLFGACHGDDAYDPTKRGFARWPPGRWWWPADVCERAGAFGTSLHDGKTLYLMPELMAVASPLCVAALDEAEARRYGDDAATLVAHLGEAGPSLVEEVKDELGWEAKRLRAARARLERVHAVASFEVTLDAADGGHRHTAELRRFDQIDALPPAAPGGLDALLVAAARAAVVAPEKEVSRFFSWRASRGDLDRLVQDGLLTRPALGWIAAGET